MNIKHVTEENGILGEENGSWWSRGHRPGVRHV